MAFSRKARQVIHDFNFFRVVKDTIYEDVTKTEFVRNSVAHIGAVAVVPVLDNGEIVLIRQYRSTIDQLSLEAVAGRRDVENEELSVCANRELAEEVGITSNNIISLGWIHTSPGFTDEKIYLFLAKECRQLEQPNPDGIEEEFAETINVSLDLAEMWIKDGSITDCKSIVNISRAIDHIRGSKVNS